MGILVISKKKMAIYVIVITFSENAYLITFLILTEPADNPRA
jgi:hypothetical protein